MDEVTIRWPNGAVESLQNIPADYIYTVVEGKGITEKIALPAPTVSAAPQPGNRRSQVGGASSPELRGKLTNTKSIFCLSMR